MAHTSPVHVNRGEQGKEVVGLARATASANAADPGKLLHRLCLPRPQGSRQDSCTPCQKEAFATYCSQAQPGINNKGNQPNPKCPLIVQQTLPKHARKKAATKCAACWLAAESAVTAPKKRDKAKSCVVWGACMRWEHTCRRGVWMQNRAQQGFC